MNSKTNVALIQLTLLLVGSLTVMAGAVIAPALPAIHAHFAADPRADFLVRLLLTMPALAIALVAPLAGYFLDRYSKQRILLIAVAAFATFGGAGLVIDDLDTLLLSRVGLGMAVAFMMSGVTSLAGDLFEPPARAGFLGRQSSANSLAGLVFLVGSGLLADLSWRAAFLVYLGAAPLVLMLWCFVPRQPRGSSAVAAGAKSPHDAIPWPLIGTLYALAIVHMAFFYLIPTQSPFLIARLHEGSATITAMAIGACTLAAFPVALAYGRIRKQFSPGMIFAIGFAAMGLGFILQGLAGSIPEILLAMAVSGCGFGLIMPNLTTTLLGASPPHLRGRISGGLISSIFLGQFLSPVFSQPLVSRYGFSTSFLIAGAALGVGAVLMLLVNQRLQPTAKLGNRFNLNPGEDTRPLS